MSALILDITIEAGATFRREFTVNNLDGSPFVFTGYTVAAALNTNAGVNVADFTAIVAGNKILIEMDEAVSALFPPTSNFQHKYDVLASKTGAPDYRIAQGNVVISAQQTGAA